MSLKVKWGYISIQKLERERWKSFACQFYSKPRPSGVGLESPGVQDIPQAPGNQAKVGQSHDARIGSLGYSMSLNGPLTDLFEPLLGKI